MKPNNEPAKYPSLKRFMTLNNYKDKAKAKKLLDKIKENYRNGKYVSLDAMLEERNK